MSGRKRHSAEDIVRTLRRADELAAEGRIGEQVAAELGVSPATLYNWRRAYGGMDTDALVERSITAARLVAWWRPTNEGGRRGVSAVIAARYRHHLQQIFPGASWCR
jgi:hypothetical protein